MKKRKVKAVQDNDGHWYVIPIEKEDKFNLLLEANGEEAEARFVEEFDEYRTGGDLNNIQLYAEI